MKLVSVPEMLAIEKEADSGGLTYAIMMENAGRGLAQVIQGIQLAGNGKNALGLVGPGNNGGDTLVALSLLAAEGWHVRAYLIKRKQDALVERLRKVGGEISTADSDRDSANLGAWMQGTEVLLDGVLGTGTRPPLKEDVADRLKAVRRILDGIEEPPYVVAVDCPSGVDCETGEAAPECLAADLTVTMAAVKRGLLRLPAYDLVGDLRVVDIGLPADLAALSAVQTDVADADIVSAILPDRPADSHKGTFGTALIVAGSVNYTGAAVLAGKAAYRAGAGLVTLGVPAPLHAALAGTFPEATWILLPHEVGVISRDAVDVVQESLRAASAVLIGPGLGLEETTGDFMTRILADSGGVDRPSTRIGFVRGHEQQREPSKHTLPALVVDADGLKLLARLKNWSQLVPARSVLTPHPGEMAILTGLSKDEIQADRESIARKYAHDWGHVVVLKGAFSVVADPDGRCTVIPIASAALARAGTGDVLAGIIVGLRAQGVEPYESAVAGAWIHAQAGLLAADRIGALASVLAGDVLASVADVIAGL